MRDNLLMQKLFTETSRKAEDSIQHLDHAGNLLMEADLPTAYPASYGEELKTLLDGILEVITKSTGACGGAIRMYSSDGFELLVKSTVGLPQEIRLREDRMPLSCGICGQAAREGRTQAVDAAVCAHLSGAHYFGTDCKKVIAAPFGFRGKPIGVFNLFFSDERQLDEGLARTLQPFGEMIGISLENVRLARESRRMHLMAERHAIANEIHDSLAQTLTFGRMRMALLQEALRRQDDELTQNCLKDVNEALDSSKQSVRELITHFRCQMDPLGLNHALQVLAEDFPRRTGIALEYRNDVTNLVMPLEHELQLFNIVREVLSNIAVHSHASRALLHIKRITGRYVFIIEDDGAGMHENVSPDGHYGLTIMRERAQRIGAEISVESAEGKGTRVCLTLSPHEQEQRQ